MRFTLTAILYLLYLPADLRAHSTEEALEELVVTGRREHLAGEARSATLAHVSLGWAGRRYALRADVLNLLDSDDRDIQYFYASRLAGEQLEGVEDRHFHRFEPRQVRVTFTINL